MPASSTYTLLVIDGAVEEIRAESYRDLAERIAARTTMPVSMCTVIGKQGIRDAISGLIDRGASEIVVVPLVLGARHPALAELKRIIDWATIHWPSVAITSLGPYAADDRLASLLVRRLSDTLARTDGLQRETVTVIVVCPHSGSADANAELSSTVRRFWERSAVRWVEVAWLAGEHPDLPTVLARCLRAGDTHVVVMPLMLFTDAAYLQLAQQIGEIQPEHAPLSITLALPLASVVGGATTVALRLVQQPSMPARSQRRSAGDQALSLLPPRYRGDTVVSAAPMAAADLRFGPDGRVAWDEIWSDFCDLALAGGPPHRDTLLEPVGVGSVTADPAGAARVLEELARGLGMVTGLAVATDVSPGWIGLICSDEAMALWLLRAIVVENITVRREGALLFLPAGPDFQLGGEIKNIVTVVAKTYHYWNEHQAARATAAEHRT